MEDAIAVIGSVNMDIGGYSHGPLTAGDSNPGRVRLSVGGVGCNIARNLALLGAKVRFCSVLGGDVYAENIEALLSGMGIDLSLSLRLKGEHTSTYLFIADEKGDMAMAVNDMGIYRHQTRAYFETILPELDRCRAVLLDANLSEEALVFLAENLRAPLFADAVSAAKAPRLRPVLGRLTAFKPNRMEAELLSGVRIANLGDARAAAGRLLDTGLERVFITLGPDGVFAAEKGCECYLPSLAPRLKNATGAGDAFTAAIAWGWMRGMGLKESCLIGSAAAAIAAEAEETVNPALCEGALQKRISEVHL